MQLTKTISFDSVIFIEGCGRTVNFVGKKNESWMAVSQIQPIMLRLYSASQLET